MFQAHEQQYLYVAHGKLLIDYFVQHGFGYTILKVKICRVLIFFAMYHGQLVTLIDCPVIFFLSRSGSSNRLYVRGFHPLSGIVFWVLSTLANE
jgi:hypothetical protein